MMLIAFFSFFFNQLSKSPYNFKRFHLLSVIDVDFSKFKLIFTNIILIQLKPFLHLYEDVYILDQLLRHTPPHCFEFDVICPVFWNNEKIVFFSWFNSSVGKAGYLP